VLNVDDLWVILGTRNFDNRSFEHNDEVNVAIRDEEISPRPLFKRIIEAFTWILERQQ
jgi:phosphatidylserine/phosphatidylglycerophosphate/cardiolipin synthase-like enzyme